MKNLILKILISFGLVSSSDFTFAFQEIQKGTVPGPSEAKGGINAISDNLSSQENEFLNSKIEEFENSDDETKIKMFKEILMKNHNKVNRISQPCHFSGI